MPFIVNKSFFVRDISIPNTNTTAITEKIDSYIAKYEPDCLLNILGYPLFKLFGSESSQRMTDLLNGAEYTDERGELQKWQGLKHDTDISLIANYIYFFIKQNDASHTTGTSTAVQKSEAGFNVSPIEKMCSAWEFFSSETQSMISFLWNKKDGNKVRVYPEFTSYQYKKTKDFSEPINTLF